MTHIDDFGILECPHCEFTGLYSLDEYFYTCGMCGFGFQYYDAVSYNMNNDDCDNYDYDDYDDFDEDPYDFM